VAYLLGHPRNVPVGVPTAVASPNGGIPIGGPVNAPMAGTSSIVVDGTPVRVVVYALAAAAGLFALRMAGIKFNVGVAA
jgi:hypothetical protein